MESQYRGCLATVVGVYTLRFLMELVLINFNSIDLTDIVE